MSLVNRKERFRCMLAGEVSFANGAFREPCILREVSETGARLVIQKKVPLPETFDLHIPKRPNVTGGIIRWRNGNEMGVEFLTAESTIAGLADEQSPEKQRDLALAENARLAKKILDLNQTIETLRQRLDLLIVHKTLQF